MSPINPEIIKNYVETGESETVEFKSRLPPDPIIGKVLSAFANTKGGILLIGVSETDGIIGLPDEVIDRTIHRLRRVMDSILPIPTEVGTVEIDGKKIVYAEISRPPTYLTPVFTSAGNVYERHGSDSDFVPSSELYESSIKEKLHYTLPMSQLKKKITVFVAMSFRNEEEPALEDYFRAMQRAVMRTELPIEITRIDLQEGDFEISQEIMNKIKLADIVIVDFTLNPQNVYFEIGFARGTEKRIIQCARKGTILEFDVRNWRTVFYRNATELEEKLITELKAAYVDVTA